MCLINEKKCIGFLGWLLGHDMKNFKDLEYRGVNIVKYKVLCKRCGAKGR